MGRARLHNHAEPIRLKTLFLNRLLYDKSWRRYVQPVEGIDDLRIAPFHVMASEDAVHIDKPHDLHMAIFAELAAADPALLLADARISRPAP